MIKQITQRMVPRIGANLVDRIEFQFDTGFKLNVVMGKIPGRERDWRFRVKSYPRTQEWEDLQALALELCLDFATYAGPMTCYLRLRRVADVEKLHAARPELVIEEIVDRMTRAPAMLFSLGERHTLAKIMEDNKGIVRTIW